MFKSGVGMILLAAGIMFGVFGSDQAAKAQAITLYTNPDSSVKPGQVIELKGKVTTANGKPAPAGTPVVATYRDFGGNDIISDSTVTDANGNYRLTVTVSRSANKTVQVGAISGGGIGTTARRAKVMTVSK